MSLLAGLGLGGLSSASNAQGIANGYSQSQLAAQAATLFNNAYQTHQAQYTQAQILALGLPINSTAAQWMIAGRVLTFDEFVNELFPDDCPERTYLILKYKGVKNDTST